MQLRRSVKLQNKKQAFEASLGQYVGLEHIRSWTGEIMLDHELQPDGLVTHFKKGDVLFGKLRPYLAKVTAPKFSGFCSTEILVLRPKQGFNARYISFALSSPDFIDRVNAATFGVKMPRASWENVGAERIYLPNLSTQRAIADFLDRETARIDLLIEKKQRLVELLGERFLSDLERKTFLGDFPSSEKMPFRWVCRITQGQVDPTSEYWQERILIAPNHIESRTGRLLASETAVEQGATSGKYAYVKGTVLYSKIRPALAKACIAPNSGMCSADMYPIIPDMRLRPEYLLMQLLSSRFTEWATLESMRVAMPKINREALGNFRLRVPPLSVQASLIEEYSVERKKFEDVSDTVRASVDRLKEYRSALITSAVTGQIDLSKWGKAGTNDRQLDVMQQEMGA